MVMNYHCMRKITRQSFQAVANELFGRAIFKMSDRVRGQGAGRRKSAAYGTVSILRSVTQTSNLR